MATNEVDAPQRMLIFGVPKRLTPKKLRRLFGCQISAGNSLELELVVPLEEANMAQVLCATNTAYEELAELIYDLDQHNENFLGTSITLCRLPEVDFTLDQSNGPPPFTNRDCLRLIFELCPLKTQIVLAKVCRLYHEVIESIWRVKYKTIHYNLNKWYINRLLGADISDFLTIAGEFVEHIVFSCAIHIRECDTTHLVDMNRMMCRFLAYVPNLRIFDTDGKYLSDWVLRSLARNCSELRVFRSSESFWLHGADLWQLSNLRECVLNEVTKLQLRFVTKLCARAPHLRTLDIVELESTLLTPLLNMLQLSCDMQHLETLRLRAVPNVKVLRAILALGALKRLQFFWYNYVEFEALLLPLLTQFKHNTCSLRFEQRSAHKTHVPLWQFSDDVVRILCELPNLNTIRCVCCRPLTNEQMLEQPFRCENLRTIELQCFSDESWVKPLERLWPKRSLRQNCRLSIESISLKGDLLENLFYSRGKRPKRNEHVLRSIECCFE